MYTEGVLTETTTELAALLSVAAARRIVEANEFMRGGLYEGWLPHLFICNLLKGQTVEVIGAGRIGSAYTRMMVCGVVGDVRMEAVQVEVATLGIGSSQVSSTIEEGVPSGKEGGGPCRCGTYKKKVGLTGFKRHCGITFRVIRTNMIANLITEQLRRKLYPIRIP